MSLYIINIVFIVAEIAVASMTMTTFQDTGMGSFYRRAAPLIDPKFKKKYEGAEESGSNREIQIGLQRINKSHDANLFEESDRDINI
jgi:hypothetical protein